MSNAQAAVSRNSAVRASGNLQRNFHSDETKAAALRLIKCLGLVLSFRNLYIVQLALEAESRFRSLSIQDATNHVIQMAQVAFERGDSVNYFWFEDCHWRTYDAQTQITSIRRVYLNKAELRMQRNLEANNRARQMLRQQHGVQ